MLEFVHGLDDFIERRVGAERKVGAGNVVGNGGRQQTNGNVEGRKFGSGFLQAGQATEAFETADDEDAANVVLLDSIGDDRLNALFRW